MTYVERLRVPAWWWLLVALLAASIAVAVFAYVPPLVGALVTVLLTGTLGVVFWAYGSATVRVADGALSIGRFRLEGDYIGGAEVLEGQAATSALTRDADVRDFLQTRPYVRDLVRVKLADPADPHPHWIVSSRHPQQLADAVNAIAGGGR